MTTCGNPFPESSAGIQITKYCTPTTPCRSCLVAEVERLREIAESVEWTKSLPPDEVRNQELFSAALLDLKRWERISRGPGAVGNPTYSFEDFLIPHARAQGAREAVPPGQVLVDARELEALRDLMIEFRRPGLRSIHNWNESMKAICARVDALRSTTVGAT